MALVTPARSLTRRELLVLADTAAIGNVVSLEDLGAIAFNAVIFNFVYGISASCV